jgi:hypothetical protein
MNSDSNIFLRGHSYGYCKFRALSLADRGLRNNSLCAGYEISMVELFKEYEDEMSQMDFDFGYQAGRFFAEMTNLAEIGKCMTKKWLDAQKQGYVVVDMRKKWLEEK